MLEMKTFIDKNTMSTGVIILLLLSTFNQMPHDFWKRSLHHWFAFYLFYFYFILFKEHLGNPSIKSISINWDGELMEVPLCKGQGTFNFRKTNV